jgi:hypothetical protein
MRQKHLAKIAPIEIKPEGFLAEDCQSRTLANVRHAAACPHHATESMGI